MAIVAQLVTQFVDRPSQGKEDAMSKPMEKNVPSKLKAVTSSIMVVVSDVLTNSAMAIALTGSV